MSNEIDSAELFGSDDDERASLRGGAAPMPEMDADNEPMGEQQDDDVDEEVLKKLKELKGAGKKKVQRPQPKLDAERLSSKKGLPVLTDIFKDVKFKGAGHESRDIGLLMGKLEHWAHRLFPKLPFDQFIERMEKLGQKRDVQTMLKRIRLGMGVVDDDFVRDEEDGHMSQDEDVEEPEFNPEAAFDEMIRQQQEREQQDRDMRCGDPESPAHQDSFNNDDSLQSPRSLPRTPAQTPAAASQQSVQTPGPQTPLPGATSSATPVGLTPEQRERLEHNKRLALERKAARMGVSVDSLVRSSQQGQSASLSREDKLPNTPDTGVSTRTEGSTTMSSSQQANSKSRLSQGSSSPTGDCSRKDESEMEENKAGGLDPTRTNVLTSSSETDKQMLSLTGNSQSHAQDQDVMIEMTETDTEMKHGTIPAHDASDDDLESRLGEDNGKANELAMDI